MGRRSSLAAALCLLLASWALSASAARIDPELKRLLDEKARYEVIPVLMVFPDQPDIEDLEMILERATPKKRRKSAIAAIKRQIRKAQSEAWEILDDPDHPGTLVYADMLYFGNAIAFGGDTELILAVAGQEEKSGDQAILFHDKDYEMLTGLAARGGAEGMKSARSDTVWNVQYIQADRVWHELGLTGEGILIGHLDTGVATEHPDLRNRLWVNPGEIPGNGVDDDGNGFIDDVHGWDFGDDDNDPADDGANAGHGTHTAGTAVGDGSGGIQTGVAPGARLLPAKVFTGAGTSTLGRIWAAQQYCVESGARIITMSLGIKGEIPSAFLRNDRFNAEAIRSTGTILFNSAGNYADEFDPPIEPGMTARIPSPWNELSVPHSSTGGVVTVGGTGYQNDEPYAQGSRGPVTWGQIDPWFDWPYVPGPGLLKPDIAAPAVGIRSTLPPSLYSGETWSGTSMACPHLAGVAALMLQKNPTLSPAGIDSLIQISARDLGNAGKDVVFGAGLVDAYAAVTSVPMDYLPNLDKVVYRPDPEGNGVVDPGELMPLAFDVTNVGIVLAEDVTGQLVIENNPHVSVLVGNAQFPDLAPGETRGNDADPFRLAISPVAPQGFSFVMELTISTGEGFERTFDLKGFVGLPEFRTHDAGQVFLTVTARGSLGYLTDAQLNGDGMGLIGGPSSLFVSSLWGGDSAAYVCNNDLTASGADPADWTPRLDPVGNVAILQDGGHEQIFAMAFTDSGHASPHDIEVTLVSHAYATTDREDAVLLEYVIRNRGNRPHPAYYAGLFVDWDVVDLMSNVGAVDMGTRSVWVGVPDGPVFGMAVAGDTPAANISLVDNLVYVYPLSHVTDTHKYQLLSGQINQAEATEPTDLSAICAAGPFSLEPGEVARATFIMTYGDDVEDFLANVVAAGGGGGPVSVVEHPETGLPTPTLMLGQNHPNPFNPSTAIAFALPAGGPVELAVFDVAGRRVRTLVSEALAAGQHTVLWDGRDDAGNQAASGIYLYKLVTETRTLTRKMMLVK